MGVESRSIEEVDDPIEYFLQDQLYYGKAERTREAYERVLRQFESFLVESERTTADSLATASQRDCMAWIHSLRGSVAGSTVATYASYLHRFYSYMIQAGALDENPMVLVMEEMNETIETDPARRDLSVEAMCGFVATISHPLERAVVFTLLKTGMRVGELCNLDCRDLDLSVPVDVPVDRVRSPLQNRPDSLFVSPDPERGAETNGEVRDASNKRKRATIIPIDAELRTVLHRWLAIRPDAVSSAEPLFVNTSDSWGERLEPASVRYVVERHARSAGWYRTGGGAEENVTPHYFRHFFTTHLRDRTGDRGIVKYLRGDVADDTIDTYTHNWGDRVREVYIEHIYTLT